MANETVGTFSYNIPDFFKELCGEFVPGTESPVFTDSGDTHRRVAITTKDFLYAAGMQGDKNVLDSEEMEALLLAYQRRLAPHFDINHHRSNPIYSEDKATAINAFISILNGLKCSGTTGKDLVSIEGIRNVKIAGGLDSYLNVKNPAVSVLKYSGGALLVSATAAVVAGIVKGDAAIFIGVFGAFAPALFGLAGLTLGGVALMVAGVAYLSYYKLPSEDATLRYQFGMERNCKVGDGSCIPNDQPDFNSLDSLANELKASLMTYCDTNYEALNSPDQKVCDEAKN